MQVMIGACYLIEIVYIDTKKKKKNIKCVTKYNENFSIIISGSILCKLLKKCPGFFNYLENC